jgi:hypothetical protein
MKLYTEEQVLEIISKYNKAYFKTSKQKLDEMNITPIELPSDKQQHEQTWIAALFYGIEKMKGLNDLESKDAFENYYELTKGGNK